MLLILVVLGVMVVMGEVLAVAEVSAKLLEYRGSRRTPIDSSSCRIRLLH